MDPQVNISGSDYLKILYRCGGFYECPTAADGKFLGPLVGYAGTYEVLSPPIMDLPKKKRQFVGTVYANFAMAEMKSNVLKFFASELLEMLGRPFDMRSIGAFVGAPVGGYSLSDAMGIISGVDVIKAEKKVIALATETSREKSKLVFARHNIQPGLRYVIVEDVCNNFSTTRELIDLIGSAEGRVVAIVCFLNRSLSFGSAYNYSEDRCIPVVCLVRKPIPEYRQDDPVVASDIAAGNVALKPKNEWPRLMQAMSANTK